MVKRNSTRNKENESKKNKFNLIKEEAAQPSEAPQGDELSNTSFTAVGQPHLLQKWLTHILKTQLNQNWVSKISKGWPENLKLKQPNLSRLHHQKWYTPQLRMSFSCIPHHQPMYRNHHLTSSLKQKQSSICQHSSTRHQPRPRWYQQPSTDELYQRILLTKKCNNRVLHFQRWGKGWHQTKRSK